jgi:hypothetical protein
MATERLLLEELVLLTQRMSSRQDGWVLTAADEELLRLAAAVTNTPLSPDAMKTRAAPLAFVRSARFRLERRLQVAGRELATVSGHPLD